MTQVDIMIFGKGSMSENLVPISKQMNVCDPFLTVLSPNIENQVKKVPRCQDYSPNGV